MDISPLSHTDWINLISTFFLLSIAGAAFYYAVNVESWCNYGRETLGLIGGLILTLSVIRIFSILGIFTADEARLINSFISVGFAFSIFFTIYLHNLLHRKRRECGLPTELKKLPILNIPPEINPTIHPLGH